MYNALGHRFVVKCDDEAVSLHIRTMLGGLAFAPDDSVPVQALSLDVTSASPPDALEALVGTVNLRAVEAASGSLLLHAGAVCDSNGQVVIMCGPSGSGKSTLTASLVGRGHAYVTDETVCLSAATLRITSFRKPVSLKRGSHQTLAHLAPEPGSVAERCSGDQWLVGAEQLGGPPLPGVPLYPELIVFPTHASGAPPRVERLALAETAYRLGSNSVRMQEIHGGGLPALARLARRAPAYRLTYGRTEDAVEAVEKLIAEDT